MERRSNYNRRPVGAGRYQIGRMARPITADADPRDTRHVRAEAQVGDFLPLQIRAMREARGWNQSELARKMGVSQSAVSQLEENGTARCVSTLLKVARAFDVALSLKFIPFQRYLDETAEFDRRMIEAGDEIEPRAHPANVWGFDEEPPEEW